MTDRPSKRAAADRMWDLVPGWTRARHQPPEGSKAPDLLRGLIEALGVGIDAVHADIDRLLDDLFVDTCEPRLVPLIGALVGVQIDPDIPVARQRHQVKYALHLRRRKGSVEQLEVLGWQLTGFRTTVTEPPSTQRTIFDPQPSAVVNRVPPRGGGADIGGPSSTVLGRAPAAVIGARAANVSGTLPPGKLEIALDVAWPVRRAQVELQRVGPDVHAIDPHRDIGLRRADGTPIFRRDDPADLVGRGLAIEVMLIGADFPVLGALRPRFMSLPDGVPPYVPDHTLAIDPERGRVRGPTAPMPGIRAYRRYRLQCWQPMQGELVEGEPAALDGGIHTFASDGRLDGLTDPDGVRLVLGFEGHRPVPVGHDERLLVVREPGHRRHGVAHSPFVLLPPGQPLAPGVPAAKQGLLLDGPGLNRLFSIEDEWGWDRFRTVRLVGELDREPPADDTVEVDVARGRFRVGPAHARTKLHVRYHRRYDVAAIKRRGAEALRRAVPLGRTARLVFRDTAPGRSEEYAS
jgi:hypothetical protein